MGDLQQTLLLSDIDIERRKRFVGLTSDDFPRIAAVEPLVIARADQLTSAFINFLAMFDESAALLSNADRLAEVQRLKRDHLVAMVSGDYNRAYVEQRLQLGHLYSVSGLDTRVFLGAFHHLISAIGSAIMDAAVNDPKDAFDNFMSIRKVAFLDIGLIVDMMVAERERTISSQKDAILRLNSELEQRVKERTTQLEEAHRDMVLAKEQAEQATQAKSAFLSSMSHELRTPLNAILGFGQLLAAEAGRATDAQKAEFVGHIIKAGKHLLTLINEILDLARIEAGKIALSPEPVALTDIFVECRTMLEPLAREREIRMIFPDTTTLHVRADRTRLKQILLNLLSNAIKYNRTQGSIVVDCAETALGQVRLSVLDTGLGLDANQLLQLFQPFSRLGQESGHQEGTGIGLVVTKRLVEMMEGTIRVTSTVDVGSNFSIELPAAEPGMHSFTGAAVMPSAPAEPPSVRRLLLYIEDNPANLKLIEEIVRFRRDLDVLSAPDGHLGVQLARVHTPDVILMDIHLPGISGIDAFQILRHDPRTAHIPVVALTASAMPREISKGLAAGFFRYITKPIDIAEVTEAIDSALVRARPARRWSRSPTGP